MLDDLEPRGVGQGPDHARIGEHPLPGAIDVRHRPAARWVPVAVVVVHDTFLPDVWGRVRPARAAMRGELSGQVDGFLLARDIGGDLGLQVDVDDV
jgi:hypothetical protein